MLESYIKEKRKQKDILLMTHIVLGYPSYPESYAIIKSMVEAGVDLMELQIPFSEPIADGPVILHANQQSLVNGANVKESLQITNRITNDFNIPFVFMSYYNILFKYGVEKFVTTMSKIGIYGAIVPDLPPEEASDYLKAMKAKNLAPVFIFTPTSSDHRLKLIADHGRGFMYCVARKGVTGSDTEFSEQLDKNLKRYRSTTPLPLALGFGVKSKKDVNFLKGKVDIAVIGTETIRLIDKEGIDAVEGFIRSLQ